MDQGILNSVEYLAGLFDGEGCVYIYLQKDLRLEFGANLTNTYLPVLEEIHNQYGGRMHVAVANRRRPLYRIDWRGQEAVDLLALISPHVRIKARQIELANEFWKSTCRVSQKRGNKIRMPAQVVADRRSFYDRMHVLNGGRRPKELLLCG